MVSGKKKYILIIGISLLVIFCAYVSIKAYRKKHHDVLKDAQVVVTIDDDVSNVVEMNPNDEDTEEELQWKEEVGFSYGADYVPVSEEDFGKVTEQATDSESTEETTEETTEEETEQQTVNFAYTEIDRNNYVNFMEQLCSINFANFDITTLPLDMTVQTLLQDQGCVSEVLLTNGFINMDNGYNDENDSFYVVFHSPNQGMNYVLIEGYIQDGQLIDLRITDME